MSHSIYSLQKCDRLTVVQAITPPNAQVYNICWDVTGKLGTGTCSSNFGPVIQSGSVIDIKADIVNSGPVGRVNVIFKIDGIAVFNDTNISLPTFRSGSDIWSPTFSGYKMPTKNIQLTVEAYGWDASKNAWILGQTRTVTISMSSPICTGIDLVPFSASIKTGEKVDLVAAISPGNVAFPVTFKDRTGSVLGSCKTNGMGQATGSSTCPFTWNSTGKVAGTYYVKAYADSCISTECIIVVNAPILQYNFNITVTDSVTGVVVPEATVMVTTTGGASQSKVTDVSGLASFRMDTGTISVSISKSEYNTFNTAESLYMDRSITYQLIPIPPIPTVGAIEFVTVPVNASIFVDGNTTGQKTPIVITNIIAGEHAWELRLSGYNNSTGKVVVPSGGSIPVYATLTPVTPTMGSLNITSTPMGAEVWIDGKDFNVTTSGATIITNIPPGNHTLTLTLPGFQDKITTFAIIAGQTTYLNPTLVPLTTIGSLEISSEPSGARVYIDDIDTQRVTTATITNLIKGSHTYKLVLDGYTDSSGTFNIEIEKTTIVHVILEKKTDAPGTGLLVVGIAGLAIVAVIMKKKE